MLPLPTTISEVTVYPDRARVTRRGKVHLTPTTSGSQWLEVSELPLDLNPDSLRASARGTARARLLGLQSQRTFFSETPAEAVRQLEKKVEDLQDEIQTLDTQVILLKQQRVNVDQLSNQAETYATALAAGEMSVEAQLAIFDGLRQRAAKLDAELQNLAVQKREKERQSQKARNELDLQRNSRPRQRYSASLEIEVLEEGDLTVELSYVVSSANWKPLYDLRLSEEKPEAPTLEVGYLAQVSQQSGEDWPGVTLALSTARPALTGKLPELDPWYISPFRAYPPPAAKPAVSRSAPLMAAMAAPQPAAEAFGAPLEEVEADFSQARIEASGASVTYITSGSAEIPADGAPHKVSVTRFALPAKLDYVTAPKLAEAVYRRATVTNDSPYILLPGSANLFSGDEFTGATELELTPPQDEIELFLGVDDRLKVERELKRRDVDKRMIGGKRRLVYAYEIELENLLPVPAKITLHDQIPVARHEEIKVKLESADPRPSEHSELNLLDWELSLQPKEKRTVRFDFSVEYPQTMEVSGLV